MRRAGAFASDNDQFCPLPLVCLLFSLRTGIWAGGASTPGLRYYELEYGFLEGPSRSCFKAWMAKEGRAGTLLAFRARRDS